MRCFKGSCLVVSVLRLVKVKVDGFFVCLFFCARGFLCDDAFITAPSQALSGHRVAHRDENEPVFLFIYFFIQSSPAAGLEAQAPAARACVITKAVRISLTFCAPLLAAGSPEACSKCCCPPPPNPRLHKSIHRFQTPCKPR